MVRVETRREGILGVFALVDVRETCAETWATNKGKLNKNATLILDNVLSKMRTRT